jgi:hypothetical protein
MQLAGGSANHCFKIKGEAGGRLAFFCCDKMQQGPAKACSPSFPHGHHLTFRGTGGLRDHSKI